MIFELFARRFEIHVTWKDSEQHSLQDALKQEQLTKQLEQVASQRDEFHGYVHIR